MVLIKAKNKNETCLFKISLQQRLILLVVAIFFVAITIVFQNNLLVSFHGYGEKPKNQRAPSSYKIEPTQNVGDASLIKKTSNSNEFIIVQTSYPDTGSTLLTNILIGLYEPADSYYSFLLKRKFKRNSDPEWRIGRGNYSKNFQIPELINEGVKVVKTHSDDLELISSLLGPIYGNNLFFVRSDRCNIDPQCDDGSVLCIKYDKLLYKSLDGKKNIIKMVASAMTEKFPLLRSADNTPDIEKADKRLSEMDTSMAKLSNPDEKHSAGYFQNNMDNKFGIHANHKGQSETWRASRKRKINFCGKIEI
mmetsp:Transcript_1933/g.4151  ORF Transcript_1933/g.4151 Transcript_1933/m.4151 type:complete len:307 (-) Transcript_1933:119-1039(-)